MTMPVGADANTATPARRLLAIVLPSPAAMPPIVALGGVPTPIVRMPSPLFGIEAKPPRLAPIQFPFTTTPVESWIRIPAPAFPEITLPSPPAPPIVVPGAASSWIPFADEAPARAAVPAAFVPIRLRRMSVPDALCTSIEATTLSRIAAFGA